MSRDKFTNMFQFVIYDNYRHVSTVRSRLTNILPYYGDFVHDTKVFYGTKNDS